MKIQFPIKTAVIDDNKTILKTIEKMITDKVEIAPKYFLNPIEAMKEIEKDNYKLVITDINMPELYGDLLIRKLIEMRLGIQIIVITGGMSLIEAYSCFKAGARSILTKPVSNIQLFEEIDNSLTFFHNWNNLLDNIIQKGR